MLLGMCAKWQQCSNIDGHDNGKGKEKCNPKRGHVSASKQVDEGCLRLGPHHH